MILFRPTFPGWIQETDLSPRRRLFVAGLLAAIFFFTSFRLSAQILPNKFDHLTIRDGMSQGSGMSILQDRKGFLWIGTEDGLNRYDGYNFKIFRPGDGPNSLSDNTGRILFEDSQGVLWIGTLNGLNRYNRDGEDFVRYLHDAANPKSLSHNSVSSIVEDLSGTLWIGTDGGGLNAYDRRTDSFRVYAHDPRDGASLSHDSVLAIQIDETGILWLGTGDGLDRFDPQTGNTFHFRHDPRNPESLGHNRVLAVYLDRTGTIWAGTDGGGLNAFDRQTGRFTRYLHAVNDPGSLSNNTVFAIFQDRLGRLFIGTNDGLNQFDFQKKNFNVLRNKPENPNSLSSDYVVSITEDRTGILWIGTRGQGLDRFVPEKSRFGLFQSIPGDSRSWASNYTRAFAEDASGALWVGFQNKGIDRLDRKTGTITHIRHDPADPTSLSSDLVYALCSDGSGGLWVGTLGGGLNRYNPATKSFRRYRHKPDDPNSLSHDSVRSLKVDRRGTLWVGTDGGGLNRFDPKTESFVRYPFDPARPGGLSHNFARTIFEDRSGTLWIGTFGGGLNRWDPAAERFTVFRHNPAEPDSLCNDFVMSIAEDSVGRLWIGTEGGMSRLNPKTSLFGCYTKKMGLPNDTIYGILVDENDALWLSSNGGLTHVKPGDRTIKTYDVSDGLQSNEFNGGAYFKSASGELFFGGSNGFNAFTPSQIRDNPHLPPVVITDFQILNKSVSTGEAIGGHVVLTKSITETEEIVLRRPDRIISLEFAALHFVSPEKNRYAYRLEGLENDWNDAAGRRFVSYANLRPGRYTFRVKASNNDGLWNETGTALKIRVLAPFWMTLWFQAGAGLVLIFLIRTAVRRRLRAVRNQADRLEREVENRTAELKQQIEVRKKTEEELARRQKYLESMLFNSFNAIVVTDAPSNIIEWSAGAERLFGWTRDEVLGKPIDDIVTKPEFKKDALQLTSFIMHGQKVTPCEAVRYQKDGSPINVLMAGSPLIISNEYVGYMAVYTDITELKKAEEAAKEASRIKSEFLANMSHEIRTPMNGIFGMTELILETQLTNEQRDYLETVKTSAESLMTIINDILDFSKIEAKKIELESVPFHLRDTVHSIVSSLSLMAEKKGLELAYDIASDVPNRVTGDPGRLRQILTNLIGNAIKFTIKGEVIVSLGMEVMDRARARLKFQVRDTGIGITPEKINLIFAPFSQADGSTTRVFGGTGLGLSICQQLVELMGGRMGVDSELGKGSTFHFSVEMGLREEDDKDDLPIPVSYKDLQGLSALIVDDNAANRGILHNILSAWGLQPTTVDGGPAALEALRRAQSEGRSYRLIITAANMPDMDGFALAEKIQDKPEYGSAIIMMLCSTGIRGDSGRCRKLGLKAYLTKPVKQSTLLDAIRLALGTTPERQTEASLITKHSLIQERPRFHILLAEDNPVNQKLAVKILENHGHRVTVVPNGEEALAAYKSKFFDLILMDVQMPRLDGFQATRRIRQLENESRGHIPIVAITANAMEGDREQCLAAGMDEYSAKPLNPVALLQTIELVMEKTREASLLV